MMLLEILILLSVSMVIWPIIHQSMGQIIRTNQELKKREVRIIKIINNAQKNTIQPSQASSSLALCIEQIESMNIAYVCEKKD